MDEQKPTTPIRILGIDPGSRVTGYGVIDMVGVKPCYVASGCIRTAEGALEQRLAQIYAGLSEVVGLHRPSQVAIERVFMAKNPDSALKLGQARGVALVCIANHGLGLAEYAARQIKQAVTGQGGADKEQVQHMVQRLLKLPGLPQADAADALATALCHAHTNASLISRAGLKTYRRGRAS